MAPKIEVDGISCHHFAAGWCSCMLVKCRSHVGFREFLHTQLSRLALVEPSRILFLASSLVKLWMLNLDPAIPLLISCYSSRGRPAAFDPADLLRSLLLMTDQKVSSITQWARILRNDRVLACLSGFDPAKTPSVGTFYAFMDRLWQGDLSKVRARRLQLRPCRKKPRKAKSGKKLSPKRPGVVKKLVDQALKGRSFTRRPERLLQEIFARCFVDHAVALGLIPASLTLSGDGTSLRTGTSPYGVKACDCRKQGNYRCSCPRRYPDPDATWGWDSYREEFYYGYSLYELVASNSIGELPLFVSVAQASRHDSVLGVVALAEFKKLQPHLEIAKAVWDSAHDAYDFYRLHREWNIEPFIELNARHKGCRKLSSIEVNQYGVPRCPQGCLMVYGGFDKDRHRLKWRCPKVAGSRRLSSQITCAKPCSPSPYGRTVYTKPMDDPRLFTTTPRGSPSWKKTYARRTSSERCFKHVKIDHAIERCRSRSSRAWVWHAHLIAMNHHLDVWAKSALNANPDILTELLGTPLAA